MNESSFYETIIKRKMEGTFLLKRLLGIAASILFALLWTLVFVSFIYVIPLVLIGYVIAATFIYIIIKGSCVEYEYSIVNGTFYFARIIGKTRRREIFEVEIKDIQRLVDYSPELIEMQKRDNATVYTAVSSMSSGRKKVMVFTDEDNDNVVFIFDSNDVLEKKLRAHNPRLAFSKVNY